MIIARDPDEADVAMTLRSEYRQKPPGLREVEDRGIPIYVLKANTIAQMQASLTSVFALEIDPREAAFVAALSAGRSWPALKAAFASFISNWASGGPFLPAVLYAIAASRYCCFATNSSPWRIRVSRDGGRALQPPATTRAATRAPRQQPFQNII